MFENKNHWPLEHWHIEVASKCSLKCPRCTRQEVPNGLINTDLRLDWFKQNFKDIIANVKKITFCGDDGDPIYCRDFLDICAWIKNNNYQCQIVIVTNGSYKTPEWWKLLSKILNDRDHIHFSIDGWDQDSNNQYRVNCDWDSIMQGISVLNEHGCTVFKTWAAIAFKFNESKITHMETLARNCEFDYFQLTRSSKFGCNYSAYPIDDPLQPSEMYVSQGRFTREIIKLSEREWEDSCTHTFIDRYYTQTSVGAIQPLCSVGNKGLYINSQGQFYPCCWTGLRYGHNKDIFQYVDQTNKTLTEILDDPNWRKLTQSFKDGSCPQECKEKCHSKKWSLEHATSW